MSSSAAAFAAQNHSFADRTELVNKDALFGHAKTSGYSISGNWTKKQEYNSYVDRWLADTAGHARAGSCHISTSRTTHDRRTASAGLSPFACSTRPGSDSAAYRSPRFEAPHGIRRRSISPEGEARSRKHIHNHIMDGIEEAPIASYLQIPPSINNSKGSLAEFAARITCLFWFEDATTLSKLEIAYSPGLVVPMPTEANPTVGFRKWVTTLLSTTQVSQNVILLALLFIYRLKKITSNVKGKAGSEYRLLTVALMLGNKFLDDNTYTNKTWADVSGISVTEIHVMEVEFLSNMKYDLYTSAEAWHRWHMLLGRFAEYFERGLAAYNAIPTPMSMPTSHLSNQPALPFTPPSEQLSPPIINTHRINPAQRQLPTPLPIYNTALGSQPRPARFTTDIQPTDLRAAGSRPASRKRSFDEPMFVIPQKQPRTSGPTAYESSGMSLFAMRSSPQQPIPRLPNPATSLCSPAASTPLYTPCFPTNSIPATSQLTLPAPNAMPHEHLWQPLSSIAPPKAIPGSSSLPPLTSRTPPSLHHTSRPGAREVSPTNVNLAAPQTSRSPSGYLMYRNSPYRPVRQVNTLLAPPPSIPTLESPLQHMSQQPTFYQPLSKGPIEPRQGMVPYLTPRQFQMAPMDPSRQISTLDFRQFSG